MNYSTSSNFIISYYHFCKTDDLIIQVISFHYFIHYFTF